jgi:hypothetical protein
MFRTHELSDSARSLSLPPRVGRAARVGLACLAVGASSAWLASAQDEKDVVGVPRVVPYQGNLEQNGANVDGPTDMVFALYPVRSGGTAPWR